MDKYRIYNQSVPGEAQLSMRLDERLERMTIQGALSHTDALDKLVFESLRIGRHEVTRGSYGPVARVLYRYVIKCDRLRFVDFKTKLERQGWTLRKTTRLWRSNEDTE